MITLLTKRMNWMRSGAAIALLTVASCSDSTVSGPGTTNPKRAVAPVGTISVGALTWLPPLGTGVANAANFDANAITRVEICAWVANTCSGASVSAFAPVPGAGESPLMVNTAVGRYEATFNLLNAKFTARKTYRIRALQGSTEVGGLLIDVVRGRWALTRTDGTLAPLMAANTLPVQFHVALPLIKINEVESNIGVPGDWVELYNAGTTPFDISGFVFKDNNDANMYVVPAGTYIDAGAYFVLNEAQFGFGLGAAESARLYGANGSLVDTYSWLTHATTTYGRCPTGTGAFVTMTTVTKGTANDCSIPNSVKFNEVESSGGVPGDWAELFNTGGVSVDMSGYVFKDNDDTHTYTIPAGTVIAAGGYFVIEEAVMGFGLGSADAVRLFDASGSPRDSYSWTAHASTTYGRCPNGTGAFITMTSVTKGAVNDCTVPSVIKVNEVESSGGAPGDWVELFNTGASSVNVSGYVFKDNDDLHAYAIPAGTIIAPGGYLVLDEAAFGFGLGGNESARLFDTGGALLDTYSWTVHATTTYGRCPNGTGAFVTMSTVTKGTVNNCAAVPPGPVVEIWPGSNDVTAADGLNVLGQNLSGLVYEAAVGSSPDVLWGAKNGVGSIYRLIFNGSIWTPDLTNGWANGKATKFTDGTGETDTEDLTFTTGSAAGMYIVSERNNSNNAVSRPSVLRYDVSGAGTTLTATNEWVLTADLPVVAANSGLEGITWIPDSYLVAQGFFDVTAAHAYNPAEYPNHGDGLFFVGLEGNGVVYVYALNHVTSGFSRIASFATGFPAGVMSVQFDRELGQLWAVCDDTCGGLSNIYVIDVTPASPTLGRMKLTHTFARPSTMPNINNEGFAFAPQSACVGGKKPAFWSDDSQTGGNAIRRASIPCVAFP